MRAVVSVEEDNRGRQTLVVTELPYQVNPDNLAQKIVELVNDRKVDGIADIQDETSGRTGQRLVIVLKRDAIAKVVLNNLYKHTQLQDSFGVNMVALVDGVPRVLQPGQDDPLLGRPPGRGRRPAHPVPAAPRPRRGRTSCWPTSRRSTRSTRSSR